MKCMYVWYDSTLTHLKFSLHTLYFIFSVVFLQCLALVMFIVGMSAWSTDKTTVSNTYWSYVEDASDNEEVTYVGLRSYVTDYRDATGSIDTTSFKFEDCVNDDSCEHCETAGQASLGMCLLAFFCLCPLVVTTGLRMMKVLDNKWLKLSSIVLTSFALFWTVVAVWNWQSGCVSRAAIISGSSGYKNGPGYNCVVCNMFWLLFSLYVHVSTTSTIAGDGSTSEPLNQEEEESQASEQEQGGAYVPAPSGDEETKKNQV